MTPKTVGLVVLLLVGLKPVNAAACESAGFRVSGISYFVATTTRSGRTGNELRAQLIMGRTDSVAMPSGAAVLVPWAYDKDCKPIAWNAGRDGGAWSPPEEAAFYTGLLRPRNQWINGLPTVDIHVPSRHPEFHGEGLHRLRVTAARTPLLSPQEFFDLYASLPTNAEYLEMRPEALRRIEAWIAAHRELATREQALWAINIVRARFAGTARSEFVRLLGAPATPRMLLCAHGHIGMDIQAVAVVEIDNPGNISAAAVSEFVLFDSAGVRAPFTRIVSVEEFTREPDDRVSLFAYFLDPGGARELQRAPSRGAIRLRIRAALQHPPFGPSGPTAVRCRVVVGSNTIEGFVSGIWAS